MKVDYEVALEILSHEAIVRQAYRDSVNVWTWSAGITSASGHAVERYIGKPQPMEHCLAVYAWLLETKYAPAVRAAFAGCRLSKAQFAAALSFHWNTGAIGRASWVKHFKAGNIAKARKAFMDWRKPPEIKERREAERDLFFDGKWSNKGTVTEYTRVTARGTPDWSSAKKVNIEAALRSALAGPQKPAETQTPLPPRPDTGQVPDSASVPRKTGTAAVVIAVLGALAAAGAAAWDKISNIIGGLF
ncbi:MAG: lysozyme [Flavobacteriaceae bacterium]